MSGYLSPTQKCPVCAGPRIVGHPSGFTWRHANTCSLRDAEDATAAADFTNATVALGQTATRPTTAAERTLLAACGVTVADDAVTTLELITESVTGRSWEGVDLDAAM